MTNNNRPLSPHLQVYRPQITSVLSILHRMTGLGLVFGLVLLTCWLVSISVSESAFHGFQAIVGSFIGRVVLFGLLFALWYHLLNGIRHLFWDAGKGIDMKSVRWSGWLTVAGALFLSMGLWICALSQ